MALCSRVAPEADHGGQCEFDIADSSDYRRPRFNATCLSLSRTALLFVPEKRILYSGGGALRGTAAEVAPLRSGPRLSLGSRAAFCVAVPAVSSDRARGNPRADGESWNSHASGGEGPDDASQQILEKSAYSEEGAGGDDGREEDHDGDGVDNDEDEDQGEEGEEDEDEDEDQEEGDNKESMEGKFAGCSHGPGSEPLALTEGITTSCGRAGHMNGVSAEGDTPEGERVAAEKVEQGRRITSLSCSSLEEEEGEEEADGPCSLEDGDGMKGWVGAANPWRVRRLGCLDSPESSAFRAPHMARHLGDAGRIKTGESVDSVSVSDDRLAEDRVADASQQQGVGVMRAGTRDSVPSTTGSGMLKHSDVGCQNGDTERVCTRESAASSMGLGMNQSDIHVGCQHGGIERESTNDSLLSSLWSDLKYAGGHRHQGDAEIVCTIESAVGVERVCTADSVVSSTGSGVKHPDAGCLHGDIERVCTKESVASSIGSEAKRADGRHCQNEAVERVCTKESVASSTGSGVRLVDADVEAWSVAFRRMARPRLQRSPGCGSPFACAPLGPSKYQLLEEDDERISSSQEAQEAPGMAPLEAGFRDLPAPFWRFSRALTLGSTRRHRPFSELIPSSKGMQLLGSSSSASFFPDLCLPLGSARLHWMEQERETVRVRGKHKESAAVGSPGRTHGSDTACIEGPLGSPGPENQRQLHTRSPEPVPASPDHAIMSSSGVPVEEPPKFMHYAEEYLEWQVSGCALPSIWGEPPSGLFSIAEEPEGSAETPRHASWLNRRLVSRRRQLQPAKDEMDEAFEARIESAGSKGSEGFSRKMQVSIHLSDPKSAEKEAGTRPKASAVVEQPGCSTNVLGCTPGALGGTLGWLPHSSIVRTLGSSKVVPAHGDF